MVIEGASPKLEFTPRNVDNVVVDVATKDMLIKQGFGCVAGGGALVNAWAFSGKLHLLDAAEFGALTRSVSAIIKA